MRPSHRRKQCEPKDFFGTSTVISSASLSSGKKNKQTSEGPYSRITATSQWKSKGIKHNLRNEGKQMTEEPSL